MQTNHLVLGVDMVNLKALVDCGLVVSTQVNSTITLWDWHNGCSPLTVVDLLQITSFLQAFQLLPNSLLVSKQHWSMFAEDELSIFPDLEAGLEVTHGTQPLSKYILVFLQ